MSSKSAPLVSVIVPCYNCERFLIATVESVLAQTFQDYEVILVDDGSTDRTAEVMRSFGSQVKATFGANQGASAARNRGTELAQGQLIQYLDADDLLRPDALEKRVHRLQESGADVAYSDWQRLEETDTGYFVAGEPVIRTMESIHSDPQIAILTSFWAPPAALLYHRRIVEAIGGWNESLPIIQDARFMLDAALHHATFVYVPGVGADYRIHKGTSLSRSNSLRFVKDVYRNACQVEAFWQATEALNRERQKALGQVYDYTARTFFLADYQLFQESLLRLYRVQPGFQFNWSKLAGATSRLLGKQGAATVLKLLGRPPINLL